MPYLVYGDRVPEIVSHTPLTGVPLFVKDRARKMMRMIFISLICMINKYNNYDKNPTIELSQSIYF